MWCFNTDPVFVLNFSLIILQFLFRRIAVLVIVFDHGTISYRNAVTIPRPVTTTIGIACPDWSVGNTMEL